MQNCSLFIELKTSIGSLLKRTTNLWLCHLLLLLIAKKKESYKHNEPLCKLIYWLIGFLWNYVRSLFLICVTKKHLKSLIQLLFFKNHRVVIRNETCYSSHVNNIEVFLNWNTNDLPQINAINTELLINQSLKYTIDY